MNAELQPIQPQEIETQLGGHVAALVAEANQAEVFDDNSLQAAIDLVGKIKDKWNGADKERKTLVKPFNDGVKAINERFKAKLLEPLEIAERIVKGKILPYQKQRQEEEAQKARAEQKRQEDERLAEAARHEAEGNTVQAECALRDAGRITVKPEAVGHGKRTEAQSYIRKRWTYEVTDKRALAAARPDLILENGTAIRSAISGGIREIPGLRIYQEDEISIRGS